MLNLIAIEHLEDERIFEYKDLKERAKETNSFIAESEKVILKLLHFPGRIKSILAPKDFYDRNHDLLTNQAGISFYYADFKLLDKIVGYPLHSGVLAKCLVPENIPLDKMSPPFLILNGLNNAENVGAILRSALAFGFRSLIVDDKSCSPYNRRATRVSMGNIFDMDVHCCNNLREVLNYLKNSNCEVIATANIPSSSDIKNHHFKKNSAIIVGNEGHGIEKEILSLASCILRIEVDPFVAHLNAACATSIFLYAYAIQNKL